MFSNRTNEVIKAEKEKSKAEEIWNRRLIDAEGAKLEVNLTFGSILEAKKRL